MEIEEKEQWLMDHFADIIHQNTQAHNKIIFSCGFLGEAGERNHDSAIRREMMNSIICNGYVVSFHQSITYGNDTKAHYVISESVGEDAAQCFDDDIDAAEYLCGEHKHDEMLYRSFRNRLRHLKNGAQSINV